MYKYLVKPILFLFSPEQAHHLTVSLLGFLLSLPLVRTAFRSFFQLKDKRLQRELFGLRFENPVGLAAGFDKDGKYFKAMHALGFGFVEIGTITPLPQAGNPQPRLFRLPRDGALINRMGFNNEGVEALAERLKKGRPPGLIIGGNLGKNKITPNEKAADDYAFCFETLFPYVDYFVLNVSSPNTPNLRALQDKKPLTALLGRLQTLNKKKENPKPILLKIAPDLSDRQLDDILEIVQNTGINGIIATNTTLSRGGLREDGESVKQMGAGGLSGQPLKKRSTEIIRYLHTKSKGELAIIGVGGIASPADAIEKLKAGASLIQLYTGLIYQGPGLIKKIKRELLNWRHKTPSVVVRRQ